MSNLRTIVVALSFVYIVFSVPVNAMLPDESERKILRPTKESILENFFMNQMEVYNGYIDKDMFTLLFPEEKATGFWLHPDTLKILLPILVRFYAAAHHNVHFKPTMHIPKETKDNISRLELEVKKEPSISKIKKLSWLQNIIGVNSEIMPEAIVPLFSVWLINELNETKQEKTNINSFLFSFTRNLSKKSDQIMPDMRFYAMLYVAYEFCASFKTDNMLRSSRGSFDVNPQHNEYLKMVEVAHNNILFILNALENYLKHFFSNWTVFPVGQYNVLRSEENVEQLLTIEQALFILDLPTHTDTVWFHSFPWRDQSQTGTLASWYYEQVVAAILEETEEKEETEEIKLINLLNSQRPAFITSFLVQKLHCLNNEVKADNILKRFFDRVKHNNLTAAGHLFLDSPNFLINKQLDRYCVQKLVYNTSELEETKRKLAYFLNQENEYVFGTRYSTSMFSTKGHTILSEGYNKKTELLRYKWASAFYYSGSEIVDKFVAMFKLAVDSYATDHNEYYSISKLPEFPDSSQNSVEKMAGLWGFLMSTSDKVNGIYYRVLYDVIKFCTENPDFYPVAKIFEDVLAEPKKRKVPKLFWE